MAASGPDGCAAVGSGIARSPFLAPVSGGTTGGVRASARGAARYPGLSLDGWCVVMNLRQLLWENGSRRWRSAHRIEDRRGVSCWDQAGRRVRLWVSTSAAEVVLTPSAPGPVRLRGLAVGRLRGLLRAAALRAELRGERE